MRRRSSRAGVTSLGLEGPARNRIPRLAPPGQREDRRWDMHREPPVNPSARDVRLAEVEASRRTELVRIAILASPRGTPLVQMGGQGGEVAW